MATTVIIDLSHHNPEPDWPTLKASGVVGVILKATEGTSYVDPTFAGRRDRALRAGLAVASYHYQKPGNVGQQMLHYLDVVAPGRGERVVVDYEDTGCTLDELEQAVTALFNAGLDLQVTVYSGSLIKQQLGTDVNAVLAKAALWIAHYTQSPSPSWPKGTWPVWSLWQYTDKAMVSGVSERVDGNRFNGSNGNAAKWLAPAAEAPVPAPVPPPEPIPAVTEPQFEISLKVDPGVTFTIWVNGEKVM